MSATQLLDAFQEAHRNLVTRSGGDDYQYIYVLQLVFKAYQLRTKSEYALAYFFLIVLGIIERLFSFAADSIRDKPGQPWRIFPRACIYYFVTMVRYVLMIAIMYVNIPIFLVICLGLTLGQIIVEVIRYWLMLRRYKKSQQSDVDSDGFGKLQNSEPCINRAPDSPEHNHTSHLSESCC